MANIIGGVQVTGFISPTDSSDTYAVTDPIYGVDGLRSVTGTTERNNITTERRREGMLVYVQSDGKYYKLLPSPWTGTNSDWVEFSVNSSGGTDTYWTSGSTGNFSIKAINNSGLEANGDYSVAMGNATSAYTPSSFAMGVNAIASGSSITTSASPITITSAITITSSDPNYSLPAVILNGLVAAEWLGYYNDFCSLFTIYSGSSSQSIDCNSYTDIYEDSGLTYIVDSSIVSTDYDMISGDTFQNVLVTNSEPAFAIGNNVKAYGASSFAEGSGTTAFGNFSHAEGYATTASGAYSHAEGYQTTASGLYSHAEGSGTIAGDENSHAEGYQTTASGLRSHAEGTSTTASNNSSHAEGQGTIASGGYSHAEGNGTTASGFYSHAEGQSTIASGSSSHAEGSGTRAGGPFSHAEGNGTTASGQASHAEGEETTASGSYSHAEGRLTIASGNTSHAEGQNTRALGDYSHAEGQGTTASGYTSHAEGYYTRALGDYSHAEGTTTRALGIGSHAEGQQTTASGDYSHAGGYNSIASGTSSFVHGQFSVALQGATIVLGNNITGTSANTTYVDNLNIKTLGGGSAVRGLGIDINGFVVSASTSGGTDIYTTGTSYNYTSNVLTISGTNQNYTASGFTKPSGPTNSVQYMNPNGLLSGSSAFTFSTASNSNSVQIISPTITTNPNGSTVSLNLFDTTNSTSGSSFFSLSSGLGSNSIYTYISSVPRNYTYNPNYANSILFGADNVGVGGSGAVNFVNFLSTTATTSTFRWGVNTSFAYSSANDVMVLSGGSSGNLWVKGTTNSNIIATSGVRTSYIARTTSYTATTSDYTINFTSSGSTTFTLPTAVGVTGQIYILKNTGAGTVTVATTSSQTIDGNVPSTYNLSGVGLLSVQSTGSNWIKIN